MNSYYYKGYHVVWFPMEQMWMAFKDQSPVSKFYSSKETIEHLIDLFEDNNGKAGEYISTTSIITEKGIQ